jgi:TonB-linked SusC/RagA family outer membrane protein
MKNIVLCKWALKFIHFMKISTWVLALLCCLSFTMIAGKANGQEVLKKRLSISFKNQRLSTALDDIAKASGVKFTYNGSIAKSTIKVSAASANGEIGLLLDKLLLGTSYSYEVIDDEIFIYFDKKKAVAKPPKRILSGCVYDDKGQPLPGATVTLKETGLIAITGNDGVYEIDVTHYTGVLVFTYLGFKPAEAVAGSGKTLDIWLETSPQSELSEVAVVAYGTQRKVSLIGAQSTANTDELKQRVAILGVFRGGRVSGFVGVMLTGEPGKDGSNIYIRGLSSFISSGDVTPLILVDGVERGINMLNIDDVQSITILKDASATAVYGVRGANGVVLLQTRRGKAGKATIVGDYYEGLTSFTKTPQMADGITYMEAVNEALVTRGQQPKYSDDYIAHTQNQTDPLLYPNVNWLDALFNKTSRNRKGNVNVSGGAPGAVYYLSASYLNQTGLLKNDSRESYNSGINFSRYNFVANTDLKVTSSTKASLSVNGYVANGNYPSQTPASIFGYAMTVPPTEFPTTYPGGFVPGKTANGSEPNPYGQLTQSGYSNEYNSQVNADLRLTQDLGMLVKGLSFTAMFAYDSNNGHVLNRYKNPDTWQPDRLAPYNTDGSLNLVKTSTGTGSALSFNSVNSGYHNTYAESSFRYDRAVAGSRFGGLLLFNQRASSDYPAGNYSTYIPHHQRGFAGRVTYSYKDRYFAEVNAGYTGSDNFAPGNRYGFFPAYGVGWLISEEPFFAALKGTLSMLKLRYSNGYVGSDDSGGPRFGYLTILREGAGGYTFGLNRNGVTGVAIESYGVNTTWSTAHKQNLGIDISIADRINLTADVFNERRDKVIMQRSSIPLFIGLTTQPFSNVGIIGNKGFDATLSGRFNTGMFTLGFNGTVTYNKARIIDNDDQASPYPWMEKRGHSPIAVYGYTAEGLFVSQDEINLCAVPGYKTILNPGYIKYRDLNNDGKINAYDVSAIAEGDLAPLTFGAGFNAAYKNFFLNAFFTGTSRAKRYINGTAIQPFSTNGGISNAYANITNRWTESNPSQDVFYPRLAYGNAANANNTAVSSWWVKDIGFIRLKNFDLGYQLPSSLLHKWGLKGSTVYMQGYNVLTFSKFKLWDPEEGTANGTQYPNVKTVALGFRAVFN